MYYATEDAITTADKSNDPAWIEITEQQYHEALAGMQDGKIVTIDGGFAIIDKPEPESEPEPEPEPSDEEQARWKRDGLLYELDSIVSNPLRWAEFDDTTKQALADYRQALLDVPQQEGFPEEIEWPVNPLGGDDVD